MNRERGEGREGRGRKGRREGGRMKVGRKEVSKEVRRKEGRKEILGRKRWDESEIALSVLVLFLFPVITVVK